MHLLLCFFERQSQLFKFLKPTFHEFEQYIEERGNIPIIDLKNIYSEVKPQLDRLYKGETLEQIKGNINNDHTNQQPSEQKANTEQLHAVNKNEVDNDTEQKQNVDSADENSEEEYDTNFDEIFDRLRRENEQQQYPLTNKQRKNIPIPVSQLSYTYFCCSLSFVNFTVYG